MSELKDVSVLAGLLTAVLLISGSAVTLIGALGLLRFQTFYERVHAPTLGTSWGVGGTMVASMIFFTVGTERFVIHEILIGIFVTVTTPITFMLLARAALHRDRAEGDQQVPHKMEVGGGRDVD